jgi:hypothetical protein
MRALLVIFALSLPAALPAATLLAKLKPATVNLGNSATLTLHCVRGQPATVDPSRTPRNLALTFVSSGRDTIGLNGVELPTKVFIYKVTPKVAGQFAVPSFQAVVGGKIIESEPLTLTVLARDGGNTPDNISKGPPAAVLSVTTPVNEVYVGQAFPLTMELRAQGLRQSHLPVPQILTEGIRFTRFRPQYQQSSARPYGGRLYHVFLFRTGAVAMKPGKMILTFEVEVNVLDFGRDVFGRERTLHMTSQPVTLNVLPLPKAGRPKNFSGAVGEFQLSAKAEPTRLQTGEPVEISVRLNGKGAVENTPVPEPANWDGFKVHPATSEIDYLDTRQLTARKYFKQMVVPMRPDITQVPPLAFSFFNPRLKKYVSLTTLPIRLQVSGPAIPKTGGGDPTIESLENKPASGLEKLKKIREQPGRLANLQPPLLTRAWFLAIPGLSLAAFLAAFAIRKREEYYDAHEAAARRLQVKRLTRQTLHTLRQPETQADATRFFSGIQLILRAHIGLTLNQPAEGITAQTLAEADLELPEAPREALDRLMSQDDLTRFANDDGPIDPPSALRDLDLVLRHLK